MISQELEDCLLRITKARSALATERHDAVAYRLQVEEKQKLQKEADIRVIESQKMLERELKVLKDLMHSLKHFAPYFATVGAYAKAYGDSSIQIDREG